MKYSANMLQNTVVRNYFLKDSMPKSLGMSFDNTPKINYIIVDTLVMFHLTKRIYASNRD